MKPSPPLVSGFEAAGDLRAEWRERLVERESPGGGAGSSIFSARGWFGPFDPVRSTRQEDPALVLRGTPSFFGCGPSRV